MKQTEKKPYIKASMNETELMPVSIIAASGAGGGEVPPGAPSSAGASAPGFYIDPNW